MAATWTEMQTKPSWDRTLQELDIDADAFATMVLEEFGVSEENEGNRLTVALSTLDTAAINPTARDFWGHAYLAGRKPEVRNTRTKP
jgi:hypothetical protein